MSFDVTNQTGQPRNSGEWSFSNHALNPKGNEFSFLPPIQGSIIEDSVDSSKNGSTDSFLPTITEQAKVSSSNDQSGKGHRLPSIKMLTELPPQQTTYTANYVPINLEGQQTTNHLGNNQPPLNSPSCLNLSAWSLNSPSMNGGLAYPTSNNGPDSYSILGASGNSRVHGPSNLSPFAFRPIPTSVGFPSMINSHNFINSSYPNSNSNIAVNTQSFNSFVDQTQSAKRRSIDGYETFEPYSSSSRSKRYSFSSYSPQIQSKKLNSDKRSSSEEEDAVIQRRSSFKEIPIQSIVQHLHLSQRDAAKSLGVSVSTLKRRFYSVRDQIGIEKWPTITTTTIQSSQQSLSNVLIKYPIINPVPTTTSTTLETSQTNLLQPVLQNVKEEDSSSSTNGISSSASCAPMQNQ